MKAFDRTLQRWRIGKVAPHLAAGGRVLDVGCADAMSAVPGEILPLAGAGCGRRVLAQVEESLLVP